MAENLELIAEGLIAREGSARGVVRRYPSSFKLDQKTPYILVAKYTTPDLSPMFYGALGIITDEGGRYCHAAIIARELNIPCIVGTKKATKLLSDFDEVFIDATGDRGRVYKIIKGNKGR